MSNCVVEGGLHNALYCQPGALRVPRQRNERAVREVQLQLREWEMW